jgi:GNAT superfamily N-acetyltransferase
MAALTYRVAKETEVDRIRFFHTLNHLTETARCPGEYENQEADLCEDFPHLYNIEKFKEGDTIVSELGETIVGTIRVQKDSNDPSIFWFNTFSVMKQYRSKGIGTTLLHRAIVTAQLKNACRLRLVTLRDHSSGENVMDAACRLYFKSGFREYGREHVPKFGETTSIDVVWMEKEL